MAPLRWRRLALVLTTFATVLAVAPAAAGAAAGPTCAGLAATAGMLGTSGNDVIEGTSGNDVIIGLAGKDTINGNGGNDLICGGGGKDTINGGGGNDTIYGQGRNDVLKGGSGNDVLRGGGGNDKLYGNSGDDIAKGNMGADVCNAESEGNCELNHRGPRPAEEWRNLVDDYFPPNQVGNALGIIDCESNGDPFIVGTSTSGTIHFWGLFQHHETYWPQRAINAGFPGETAFHPEANIAAAFDLWSTNGWSPWPFCSNMLGI